ncbi:dTMP kinase [Candidatus Nesciobacter abundans]|uniref:Thymidylate kinase n=1 Tax=Candidatus Nesciobacter abundans TaxID=2601668 RepID=A0A5C0UHP3_9PROT|nr:dTMP kinase [Candidatus Nesciobacter abundans]
MLLFKKVLGLFIVFEGIDGVGKTSHINSLKDFLMNEGLDVIVTSEFSEPEIGKDLKQIFVQKKLANLEELLLVNALRSWHYRKVIQPALNNGKCVIMDRFIDSTWAYQINEDKNLAELFSIILTEIGMQEYDMVFWLTGKNHRNSNLISNNVSDRFDSNDSDFFEKVHRNYEAVFKNIPSEKLFKYENINFDSVQEMIRADVLKVYNRKLHI